MVVPRALKGRSLQVGLLAVFLLLICSFLLFWGRQKGTEAPSEVSSEREHQEFSTQLSEQAERKENVGDFYRRMRGHFQYSPYGRLAQVEAERQNELQSGADIRQAIPFLGAWLIQEFMNLKGNQDQG